MRKYSIGAKHKLNIIEVLVSLIAFSVILNFNQPISANNTEFNITEKIVNSIQQKLFKLKLIQYLKMVVVKLILLLEHIT